MKILIEDPDGTGGHNYNAATALGRRLSRRRRNSFWIYNSESKIRALNSKNIDMPKTEIELENKDTAATKIYRSFPETSPALWRPFPLSGPSL